MLDKQTFEMVVGVDNKLLDVSNLKLNKPFSQEIFLLNTQINGLQYVRGIKKLAEKLKKGDELVLVREVENEHDKLAVMIKNTSGKKLGYLPRYQNEVIARLLDAGKRIVGRVKEVRINADYDSGYNALNIYFDVFMIE